MNSDTYMFSKPLNEYDVMYIIGNNSTVTFNDNVTVYMYPKKNNFENEQVNKNWDIKKIIKKFNLFKRI
jgi:hypothetical protein